MKKTAYIFVLMLTFSACTKDLTSLTEPLENKNEFYEIEKIVDHKVVDNILKFRIRWKGYTPDKDTWEPLENFSSTIPIKAYQERIKQQLLSNEENKERNM